MNDTSIRFVDQKFVLVASEPAEPMGGAAWHRLQPDGQEAADIAAAIARLKQAQVESAHRLDWLQSEREWALLHGTATSLALSDAKILKAKTWHERVDALAAVLPGKLAAAQARADRAAREKAALIEAARPVIAKFRRWVEWDYTKHAEAIRDGLALEQEALAAARIAGIEAEVPRAHTGLGHSKSMRPTSFGCLVRLPNAASGSSVCWPPGEPHPIFVTGDKHANSGRRSKQIREPRIRPDRPRGLGRPGRKRYGRGCGCRLVDRQRLCAVARYQRRDAAT